MYKKSICIALLVFVFIFAGSFIGKGLLSNKPLTTEQKLEDFNYLYSVLIEHQPMLEGYKEVIGFDFEGNREYYEELIRNTKDDYEFYVMMEMIMGDFPSAHTGLDIEAFSEIKESGHTYSKEVKKAFLRSDRSEYWQEHSSQYLLEETGETPFLYYDGKYISNLCSFAEKREQALILLSINGESIDEYIQRKEVNGELAYDTYNNKIYRYSISLNLMYGELVKATFQNSEGVVFDREVYIRNKDCAFEGERILPIDIPEVERQVISEEEQDIQYIKAGSPFKVALDKKRNLSYIVINSLEYDSIEEKAVFDAMQKACEHDNIILELRINRGGNREFFLEHIYPWLFKEDISISLEYYLNKMKMTSKLDNRKLRKYFDMSMSVDYSEGVVKLAEQYQGKGDGTEDKNVYVLVSDTTYSAADWAAATLKEYTSAVVIGTNTGGEGLAGTAFYDIMPNSKMTFMVQDSQGFNSDGTDNSIYGTSPDYYVPHTFESIAKRNQLLSESVAVYDYEYRLKWDNVLLETIEMINGEEP